MAEEPESSLVMPFVTVATKGGPHDDESYVAGYAMGLLDAKLSEGGHQEQLTVRDDCLPQVDLLAFRYGYTVAIWDGEEDFDGWCSVTFNATQGVPDSVTPD